MSAVITPYRVCNRCEDFNVGYASKDSTAGGKAQGLAPFFVNVTDSTGIKLSDISVSGYKTGDPDDPGTTIGDVHIHILDGSGRTASKTFGGEKYDLFYNWCDESEDPDGEYAAGWYDANFDPLDEDHPMGTPSSIKFTKGDGLWVYGQSTDHKITFAGAITGADVEYTSPVGGKAMMIGNVYAVDLPLSAIIVSGYKTGDPTDPGTTIGDVHIHILDGSGRTASKTFGGEKYDLFYNWCDESEDPDGEYAAGWYDANFNPLDEDHPMGTAETILFAPGQGLWCYGQDSSMTIKFSAPAAVRDL